MNNTIKRLEEALAPRPFPQSKSTPWLICVPRQMTGTKRVRKYFKTQEEAQQYVTRLWSVGYAKADMRENGQENGESPKPSLEYCARQWLERHKELRPTYLQLRQHINRLIARHGRDPIDRITHVELDAWLRSLRGKLAPETCHNCWRITRRFFAFCHDFLELIPRNPMLKLKEPAADFKEPELLTPEQMRACLSIARGGGNVALSAYLCLGGFAGIRTEEILRMDWDDLNWVTGEVWVRNPKKVTRWRPRPVEMLPALRRNLEGVALKGDQIEARARAQQLQNGRPTRKIIPGGQRALFLARRTMMDELKWKEWPNNCLRHSYKSYHLAVFQDLEKLRVQMGHSDQNMTRYNYGAPEVRAVAEEWWAL
jgi:integrase